MINVMKLTPAFETAMDRIIENSDDEEAAAQAVKVKEILAELKAVQLMLQAQPGAEGP